MSDETPVEDTLDVSAMSQAQLRDHYAQLTTAIDTLNAEELTIETGEAIRALKVERNAVATAVNQLVALSVDAVEDTPIAETEASDLIVDALNDTDADDTVDETVEAETDTTVTAIADEADTGVVTETVAPAAVEEIPTVDSLVTQPEDITAGDTGDATTAVDTAMSDDVSTPSMEETPVAETPDQNVPSAAETEALVAEAQSIADNASLAVVAGMPDRPTGATATIERPKVGYRAGGGQSEFVQGTEVGFEDIARVMRSVQRSGRDTGSGVIVNLPSFDETPGMPNELLTTRISAIEATAMINETVDAWKTKRDADARGELVDAVTASICTPLDIVRDIPACGVTDTPFADSLPQRGVGRLGFQYFPAMALTDTAPNVNIWTEEDQDAIAEATPSTWKPAPLIECAEAVSVTAQELVAAAQVDNSTNISQPEQVVQFMHKMAVMRARVREQYLLGLFDATASPYTHTGDYGAMAALLSVGLELMPRMTYGERLDEGDYDLVLEPGHFNKLLQDENNRVYGDTLASRKAAVISKLKDELGVGKVIILRDFRTGTGTAFGTLRAPGASAVAMPRAYDANRIRFNPAGAYLFGATGEEATGWETDPQLTRQNRMQWFSKEWLLLAKHGCHPAVTVDLVSCGNGSRGNGVTPVDCTSQTS